jgi:ATP-dependent RNA helicase DeaD
MSASFAELGLSPEMLEGVTRAGYDDPTPIQAQSIPILLKGQDLVAQAQTGTGKTAAFALPILQTVDPEKAQVQALILAPTRELAVQVSEAMYGLGRTRGVRVLPVYGGQGIDRQLRALRAGVQVVVGTPGRLLDHLRRDTLDLANVRTVVLDEADEMLAMGFIEDIEQILEQLPGQRQIALFSATMPAPIARLAGKFLKDAQRVTIAAEPQNIPQIRQSYYEVSPAQKLDALTRILDMETPGPTIVFCRTKRECDELGEHLRGRGYLADTLHGDLNQMERDRVMRRFKQGQSDLLIATDVAARGLDIETVTHVINYDIPWDIESYTHRIGRTGRAGREGDAITLVTPRERRQLKLIERVTGARIQPVRVPTAADIAARRRELFKRSVLEAVEAGDLDHFLATVDELSEQYEPSEVAAAALKLLWAQQKNAVDIQAADASDGVPPEQGMTRLFLSIGRDHGLRPTDLVGAIANEAGISGRDIGAIDIMDRHAFVEVPSGSADAVVRALLNTKLRGRRVRVQPATPAGEFPAAEPEPEFRTRAPRPGRPVKYGGVKGKRPGRPFTGGPAPERKPGPAKKGRQAAG